MTVGGHIAYANMRRRKVSMYLISELNGGCMMQYFNARG